jgi:hypothetical protein
MRLLLIIVLIVAWAGTCIGGVEVALYSDPEGRIKCLSSVTSGFQIMQAEVVVTGDVAIKSVSFTAGISGSPPGCAGRLIWLGDSKVFPQTSGSSPAGVEVDFGECLTPPIHVLSINILSEGLEDCCFYCVGQAQAVDCSDQSVPVAVSCTRVVPGPCELTVPTDPIPVDGAENVSTDVELGWTSAGARTCALGEILYYNLYFGTTTDPPMIGYDVGPPFDPGNLSPGTLYFWRVLAWQPGYAWVSGPLWRFRTAGGVPADNATWGRIKALYE